MAHAPFEQTTTEKSAVSNSRACFFSSQHDALENVAKLMVVTAFTMTMTNDDEKVCEQELSLEKFFPQNLDDFAYSDREEMVKILERLTFLTYKVVRE